MGEAIIFHGRGYVNNTPSSSSENGALIRVHTYIGVEITIKNTTDNKQTTKIAESEVVDFNIGTSYGSYIVYENGEEKVSVIVDTLRIYEVNLNEYKTYGFRLYSNGTISYTDDAQGKQSISYDADGNFQYGDWEDFIKSFCKPCLLSYDGTEIIYLNPDDFTEDENGNDVSSYITGANPKYNVMIEFSPLFYEFQSSITNRSLDYTDFKVSTHKGNAGIFYKDSSTVVPVYFSAYEGILKDGFIQSLSGVQPSMYYYTGTSMTSDSTHHDSTDPYWLGNSIKHNHFSEYNNFGKNYDLEYWSFRSYLLSLLVLICGTIDIGNTLGRGVGRVNNNYNSDLSYTGILNKKGLFAKDDSTGVIKCFGIENLWGNSYSILQDGFSTHGTSTSECYFHYGSGDSEYSLFLYGSSVNNTYTLIESRFTSYNFIPFRNNINGFRPRISIQDSKGYGGVLVGGCGTNINSYYDPFFIVIGGINSNSSIVGSGTAHAGYINPRLTYKKIS